MHTSIVFVTSALFLALTVVAYPTIDEEGTVTAGTSTSGSMTPTADKTSTTVEESERLERMGSIAPHLPSTIDPFLCGRLGPRLCLALYQQGRDATDSNDDQTVQTISAATKSA
ncbi:uncharacterized protein LOC142350729 [Convolutriloba macropyga]|uniref:uncharacterized protein LOC142350729 n=1 Tax=Convolutriloba macropyga TaxID=536237 RepID=UPI003F528ABA